MYIDDPRKWRISKSGYTIRTGWADEKKIIAKFAGDAGNAEQFQEWLENAGKICERYNAQLANETQPLEDQQFGDALLQTILEELLGTANLTTGVIPVMSSPNGFASIRLDAVVTEENIRRVFQKYFIESTEANKRPEQTF